MEPDPIEDYLNQLRRGLLTPPGETRLILAEAEDHLRESISAGVAAGLAEREATQAAISSFGPVRAVIRAHLPCSVASLSTAVGIGAAARSGRRCLAVTPHWWELSPSSFSQP